MGGGGGDFCAFLTATGLNNTKRVRQVSRPFLFSMCCVADMSSTKSWNRHGQRRNDCGTISESLRKASTRSMAGGWFFSIFLETLSF